MGKRGRKPDPLCQQRLAYSRHRCQARHRNEYWELTWDQWWDLWQPHWDQRGMALEAMNMIRHDPELSWTLDNVYIGPRSDYLKRERTWKKRG